MEITTEYISANQAAKIANVSTKTIIAWIEKKLFEANRPKGTTKYRIDKNKFLIFLNS